MKIKVLVGIGVAVVVLVACLWRYSTVQRRSRLLSTRARSAIYAGGNLTQCIAVCLLNSHERGFQIANFVQSAVRLAASPLRVVFLCVSDPTASVPIEREVEYNTRDLDFRVDLRTAYAEEPGFFNALCVWREMVQAAVPSAVLFINPERVHILSGWDQHTVQFLTAKGEPGVLYSGTSPSTFATIDEMNGKKYSWPLLSPRPFVSSAEGISVNPVPNLLVDPSTMLLHGATAANLPVPGQALRGLRVPELCGPLLVTDYLLRAGVRPATLPCPFFRPVSASSLSASTEDSSSSSNEQLWRSVEKNFPNKKRGERGERDGEATDAADRILAQVTKDWVGIGDGLTVLPRSICGLTASAIDGVQQTEESVVKYGSRTQAIAAVYEVSGSKGTEKGSVIF
jgi:hypothetical protein